MHKFQASSGGHYNYRLLSCVVFLVVLFSFQTWYATSCYFENSENEKSYSKQKHTQQQQEQYQQHQQYQQQQREEGQEQQQQQPPKLQQHQQFATKFNTCLKEVKAYPCCDYAPGGHNCCGARWNEQIRFFPMKLNSSSVIVDIGGNIGSDAKQFLKTYNPATYHIFEPVPKFIVALQKAFPNDSSSTTDVFVHKYGLAEADSRASFLVDGAGSGQFAKGSEQVMVEVEIRDTTKVFLELQLDGGFDMLQLNCEGCEWNVLEVIIDNLWHWNIRYIQFGTHRQGGEPNELLSRYCRIQEKLSESHRKVDGLLWSWERWVRHSEF